IRDQLSWVYGSGFPKSHDVSKAIDRAAGAEREVVGDNPNHRPVSGVSYEGVYAGGNTGAKHITRPATAAARQWQGWGTALKPAWEPICLARKPLVGTVAENVLKHGTGALNIDGCRVATDDGEDRSRPPRTPNAILGGGKGTNITASGHNSLGRWPANIVHDGSDEVVACFPETGPAKAGMRGNQHSGRHGGLADIGGNIKEGTNTIRGIDDSGGSAARFFYSAKADKLDRIGSKHPTVKPVDLMQWLVRLVTPKGGLVLDPFAGSGSTGEAAWREGMRCILIEREEEYQTDIARRMELAAAGPTTRKAASIKQASNDDLPLFGTAT